MINNSDKSRGQDEKGTNKRPIAYAQVIMSDETSATYLESTIERAAHRDGEKAAQ